MTHGNFADRPEEDPPFGNEEEQAQYRELQEILRTSRRGSQERRDAIEELRKLRRLIETRDRTDERW
jgi:hypothetical protein